MVARYQNVYDSEAAAISRKSAVSTLITSTALGLGSERLRMCVRPDPRKERADLTVRHDKAEPERRCRDREYFLHSQANFAFAVFCCRQPRTLRACYCERLQNPRIPQRSAMATLPPGPLSFSGIRNTRGQRAVFRVLGISPRGGLDELMPGVDRTRCGLSPSGRSAPQVTNLPPRRQAARTTLARPFEPLWY